MAYNNDNYREDAEMTDYVSDPFIILKSVGVFLGILFAPTVLISVLVFVIFMRILKWKPIVTTTFIGFLLLILFLFSKGKAQGLLLIFDFSNLSSNWPTFLISYLYFATIAGLILGLIVVYYKAFELKRYPEYVHLRGWAYKFKYAPTPLDLWRKKQNISALKNGELFDYEKAPIGVIEEPVIKADLERTKDLKNANRASVVYRYYTEAMAHTLITGLTGSGKALHKDTEIREKTKGWTTVENIEVGDTLYDEAGNYTLVKEKYRPMIKDHYEITFSNGEKVKACGDHLWNIGNVYNNNTVSTRELYRNYSYKNRDKIIHWIDGEKKEHEILIIKMIEDVRGDYYCFTVDSKSHLFLITRSHIPTHNTVTMLNLIKNDILSGHPVCVIDFKKSPDLIYFLSKWAKENDREFYHFVSGKPGTYKNPYKKEQSTYDPLSTGGATAKADMILNLRSWDTSSEVFKKRTQDVLQSLFFLLERTPRKAVPEIDWDSGGLAQFVSALDLNNFKKMIEIMAIDMQAERLSPGDVRRYNTLVDLYRELSSKSRSDIKAQIVELHSIARTLIVSNYGDWLAKGTSGSHINLMDIATDSSGPIVLFSFNQQEEPEFAEYVGSIVMSDLSRVSALKNAKGDETKFGVYIDEFQTLDPRTVKDNLEKARSSKMYITLSLQSIDQIVSSADSAGEAMANAILDTCANFIFHDGSGHDTAEKMSKIIGKSEYYVSKTTAKANKSMLKFRLMSVHEAMVSKTIENDWLIAPKDFQSLDAPSESNGYKATAYVINKAPDDDRFERSGGALARKVHVIVPEETAAGVPQDFKRKIFIPRAHELEFSEVQQSVISNYMKSNKDDGDWKIEDIDNVKENRESVDKETTGNESTNKTVEEAFSANKENKSEKTQLDIFNQLAQGSNNKKDKKEVIRDTQRKNNVKLPKLD